MERNPPHEREPRVGRTNPAIQRTKRAYRNSRRFSRLTKTVQGKSPPSGAELCRLHSASPRRRAGRASAPSRLVGLRRSCRTTTRAVHRPRVASRIPVRARWRPVLRGRVPSTFNLQIVNFTMSRLGTQLGDGECRTLAAEVLEHVGARLVDGYKFGAVIPSTSAGRGTSYSSRRALRRVRRLDDPGRPPPHGDHPFHPRKPSDDSSPALQRRPTV